MEPKSETETAGVWGKPPPEQSETIDRQIISELQEVMEEEFADLLETYLSNAPALISQIEEAAGQRRVDAMILPAHSLKSSSANVGALHLSELAKQVELSGKAGDLEAALVAFSQLPDEMGRVIPELRRIREGLSGAVSAGLRKTLETAVDRFVLPAWLQGLGGEVRQA